MDLEILQISLIVFLVALTAYSRLYLWQEGYDIPLFRKFPIVSLWTIFRNADDFYARLFSLLSMICIPIAFGVFFLFIPFIYDQDHNNRECLQYNYFLTYQYNGTVRDKYIDTINHNNRHIILSDSMDNKIDVYEGQLGNLYEDILIGDIVFKRLQSDTITIIHNNDTTDCLVKFDCDTSLFDLQ